MAKPDPRGDVVAALAPWRERLESVNVDSAGIGYYLGKHLDDLDFPVRLVNVGQSSSDGEKYANKKGEFYWGLRMRFQAGDVAGLTDERTISQLAGILYEHDARGRAAIESKEDARKRGVKSPDRAEAIMVAFAAPALGWTVLGDDLGIQSPEGNQLPSALFGGGVGETPDTCGTCGNFEAGSCRLGRCILDGIRVAPSELWCPWFQPA